MGLIVNAIKGIFRVVTGPLGVLEDYAREPIKNWDSNRREREKDADLRREIERNTAERRFESEMKMKEASHNADLEIRMQTEINKINAETEQWVKDEEFRRHKETLEAFEHYMETLSELNLKTVRAIGLMDIELRAKAQALIFEKTTQYKQLQGEATKDAEEELERIIEKFSSNERAMNIMITASEKKLTNILNATSKFMEELSIDINKMNDNIDLLTQKGQDMIAKQLGNLKPIAIESGKTNCVISDNNHTEDAEYLEVNE